MQAAQIGLDAMVTSTTLESNMSDKRLLELDSQLRTEVDQLFALTEHAEQTEVPEGWGIADAIAFRHERLANLAKAKAV
jgi:hypothetical protein